MLPHPALLLLIPAPALAALALRLRASHVIAAGLAGAAVHAALAVAWPTGRPGASDEAYYVVANGAVLVTLALLALVLLAAQRVKERRGREDRLTTVTLFLMALIGATMSLLPVATLPPATQDWRLFAANLGSYLFLAGLLGLVHTILLRPLLGALRGRG